MKLSIVLRQLGLVLLYYGLMSSTAALAINFNAYWLYQQIGSGDNDPVSSFLQRYNFGAEPSLGYAPTHALGMAVGTSYTRNDRKTGDADEFTTVEELGPEGRLILTNDIFTASLAAETTKSRTNKDSAWRDGTDSWGLNVTNNWEIPYFPKVYFSYSERSDPGFNTFEEHGTRLSLDWTLPGYKLAYQFTNKILLDGFSQTELDSDNHFARFNTGRSLLGGRIRLGFTQTVELSENTLSSTQPGGPVNLPLEGMTLSLVADPLLDPSPEFVELVQTDGLDDGDLETAVVVVDPDLRAHLGITLDLSQPINELQIYLDPEALISDAQVAVLQWILFIRDDFNNLWEPSPGGVLAATYDPVRNLISLRINTTADEIMVVAVNTAPVTLPVTEFVATRAISGDSSRSTSASEYKTSLGINSKLSRNTTLSTGLSRKYYESETGAIRYEREELSINNTLSWNKNPSFRPVLKFGARNLTETDAPDKLNLNYSLIVNSVLLPTVNSSLGVYRSEQFLEGVKTNINTRYNLSVGMKIYPSLTSNISMSHIISENEISGFRRDISDANLNVSASFSRTLTGTVSARYNESSTTNGDETENKNLVFRLAYRPSDYLQVNTTYSKGSSDEKTTDLFTVNSKAMLLSTRKARLSLEHTFQQTENDEVNNFYLQGNWKINNSLSMRSQLTYIIGEANSYFFLTSLNLVL